MTPILTVGAISPAFATPMMLGECPLWHPQQQLLYWVDIPGRAVHQLNPANGSHQQWAMASEPTALAWSATGGLIVASRSGFAHLNTDNGTLTPIAPASYNTCKARCNDGRCDAAGRFWVGTLCDSRELPAAEMLCLERGQLKQVWQGGMTVSNGLAFAADQKTLFHADTTSHQIRRHTFDVTQGSVGPAQLMHQFNSTKDQSYGGRPDGAAIDSEGAYWCAMYEGGCLLRMTPEGEILQKIPLPVRCPTMLAFGGADLKTLYITTASDNRPADELVQYPLSGCVLTLQVPVAGRAEYPYLP